MNADLPTKLLTVGDWLQWLETLHPKKIDLSLDRVKTVIKTLSLTNLTCKIITVGGTNGKGSCVALLESIYREAGFQVGTYTSPHLWRFNERIRFNAVDVSDEKLIDLFVAINNARGNITLSYFEYATLAALLYFAWEEADIALLEVGLGGRLDAVNAVDSDASLLASIAIDHQEWLGETREKIGYEKAGIMRPRKPAILADRDCPESVISFAEQAQAPVKRIGYEFDGALDKVGWIYNDVNGEKRGLPFPAFGGDEQLANAAGCVAVVEALQQKLPVSNNALVCGLEKAQLRARAERLEIDGVTWVFDVAHNPAAAITLSKVLDRYPVDGRTLAVVAIMANKDLVGVLAPMLPTVDEWLVTHTEGERCASTKALAEALGEGVMVTKHPDIATACEQAKRHANQGDRILVYGSFYLVGPAMSTLGLYFGLT